MTYFTNPLRKTGCNIDVNFDHTPTRLLNAGFPTTEQIPLILICMLQLNSHRYSNDWVHCPLNALNMFRYRLWSYVAGIRSSGRNGIAVKRFRLLLIFQKSIHRVTANWMYHPTIASRRGVQNVWLKRGPKILQNSTINVLCGARKVYSVMSSKYAAF